MNKNIIVFVISFSNNTNENKQNCLKTINYIRATSENTTRVISRKQFDNNALSFYIICS